jgi:hypothetical protein
MTAQQRDMAEQILRDAPFDLGRDVAVQRPLLEQTLTSQPPPPDVCTTTGDLGGIPVILNNIADVDPGRTIFHIHGGGFALGSAGGSAGLASSLARETGMRAVPADYLPAPEHPYPTPAEGRQGRLSRPGQPDRPCRPHCPVGRVSWQQPCGARRRCGQPCPSATGCQCGRHHADARHRSVAPYQTQNYRSIRGETAWRSRGRKPWVEKSPHRRMYAAL